jgi:hypothetical protein
MFRLRALMADQVPEGTKSRLSPPTHVKEWERFIDKIRPANQPEIKINTKLRQNVAHRFQLLEFETALLLCASESYAKSGFIIINPSVHRLKIHQFCVIANSILEGIGSHFYKVQHAGRGTEVNTDGWRKALKTEIVYNRKNLGLNKTVINNKIKSITDWRDKIHLDNIEKDDQIQYSQFSFDKCFRPSYKAFHTVISALNPSWPENCCLNESIDK